MREIKFRVWNNELKEFDNDYYLMINRLGILIKKTESWTDKVWEKPDYDFKEMPPKKYEIMQYTGLKDKNGKEIYEGDIVKGGKFLDYTGIVKWNFKSFEAWEYPDDDDWGEDTLSFDEKYMEVIGNIYENPELMESRVKHE